MLFLLLLTSGSTNTLYSYDVSADLLTSPKTLTLSGSNVGVGEIIPFLNDPSIMFITSNTNQVSTKVHLWVVQINADGSMTELAAFQGFGNNTTNGYTKGCFVTYNSNIYYVANSSTGFFSIWNCTNFSPTSIAPNFGITGPKLMPMLPSATIAGTPVGLPSAGSGNVTQAIINSNFDIYLVNRTTAAASFIQVFNLTSNNVLT